MKKKITVYMTAAAAMLACTACAGRPDAPLASQPSIEEQTGQAGQDISQESDAESAADTNTGQAGEQSVHISITFETEDTDETAEDGTVLYASSCIYPVVAIEGNDAAANKINEDILARVDSFRSDTSTLEYAKEEYDFFAKEENSSGSFMQYASDLWFSVARADNNVISFVEENYNFSGGAHGYTALSGVNYDAGTGEVISFDELSGHAEKFHADTLAYNQMLAETDDYKERMFEPDIRGDLEEVLYAENKWYLSTSGLVFISDPYSLGPYAAGTIEFVIPYSELEQMGLKEEYSYDGTPVLNDSAS